MEVGMPWKETGVVEKRFEFVLRARSGSETVSDLCRGYGISRKTGHKWLKRYAELGTVNALFDRPRKPRGSPSKTRLEIEERVVQLRKAYGWSGRKLSRLLRDEGVTISRSTVDRIIKRSGLVRQEDQQKPATKRFERKRPNELWQMDIKGEYILRGVHRCYPLSILDDHSRYAIGLFPMNAPSGPEVRACLVSCFEDYGLPDAMLMDHGTPWWKTTSGHGLTRLSVDLIKQGIQLIYGSVAHPQTQGKVERFHLTLKRALRHRGVPQHYDLFAEALREFRHIYNEIRPHEALGDETPATKYRKSPRPYDPQPRKWEYPERSKVTTLNTAGHLDYEGHRFFVSEALAGEEVAYVRLDNLIVVRFRHMLVREIDLDTGHTRAVARSVNDQNV